MRKKNKHITETEKESCAVGSESSNEYVKYIKKLELQRIVLNKIVNTDLNQITASTSIDPGSADSN